MRADLSPAAARFLAEVPRVRPMTVRQVGHLAGLPYGSLLRVTRELVAAGRIAWVAEAGPGTLGSVRRMGVGTTAGAARRHA